MNLIKWIFHSSDNEVDHSSYAPMFKYFTCRSSSIPSTPWQAGGREQSWLHARPAHGWLFSLWVTSSLGRRFEPGPTSTGKLSNNPVTSTNFLINFKHWKIKKTNILLQAVHVLYNRKVISNYLCHSKRVPTVYKIRDLYVGKHAKSPVDTVLVLSSVYVLF